MAGLTQRTEEDAEKAAAAAAEPSVEASAADDSRRHRRGRSERHRDAAKMRDFLTRTLKQLHDREVAYQQHQEQHQEQQSVPISAAHAHADCLLLLSADGECESLRAVHATAAILAAADAATANGEQQHRLWWRRVVNESGGLWLDYSRTVERFCCRIEAAFLQLTSQFAARADSPGGGGARLVAEARQLALLADTMARLEGRMDVALSPEFEACRNCLQRFLAKQGTAADDSRARPKGSRVADKATETIERPGEAAAATVAPRPRGRMPWTAAMTFGLVILALVLAACQLLLSASSKSCWGWWNLQSYILPHGVPF